LYSIILTLITQQNCVQMNICIHVEYLVVMDMHFFHIMENHIMWRVKLSLVLKLPPNLHYQRRKTSPMLLSSEHKSLNRLCAFIRCNKVFIPSFQVRVTRSFAWCVCFVDRCLSFCTFSFGHCVVCSSSIYGFWLPLWY
jgi:hypothetical protein